MNTSKIVGEGLTYDDVLLIPQYSQVLPRETNLATRLLRGIMLHIPLVSAAMDTVTESAMAIALAREGGIGIVHKNMTIDQQAEQVQRVKRSESGMILNPITLGLNSRVGEALQLMRKYSISGVPIIDDNNLLVGIVTNRDLRFQPEQNLPITEVMTSENIITAPLGTTLEGAEAILQKHGIEKLPVVDSEGRLHGLITFKDIRKKRQHPHAAKDDHGRLRWKWVTSQSCAAKARKDGVYLRVLKNTLARRAVAGTPFEGLAGHMAGPLIYGISKDPVAAAKVLNEFAKSNDKLVIKAGAMCNYVMDANGVKALASMPSREELLATLLGTMQAPVAKFVRTLNEVPGKFVRTFAALRDQKEAA